MSAVPHRSHLCRAGRTRVPHVARSSRLRSLRGGVRCSPCIVDSRFSRGLRENALGTTRRSARMDAMPSIRAVHPARARGVCTHSACRGDRRGRGIATEFFRRLAGRLRPIRSPEHTGSEPIAGNIAAPMVSFTPEPLPPRNTRGEGHSRANIRNKPSSPRLRGR